MGESAADQAEAYLHSIQLRDEKIRLMKERGVCDGASFFTRYGKKLMDLTDLEAIQLMESRK